MISYIYGINIRCAYAVVVVVTEKVANLLYYTRYIDT